MSIGLNDLGAFVKRSILDPKAVAEALNAVRLTRDILWMLLLLVVALRSLTFSLRLMASPDAASLFPITLTPLSLAVAMAAVLVILVFAIYFAGQMLGGTGRFPGALLMVIWLQGMAFVFQAAELLAFGIAPLVSALIGLFSAVWVVVALIIAINVLHGFNSVMKSIAVVLIAFLGPVVGVSFILTLIGVTVQGVPA